MFALELIARPFLWWILVISWCNLYYAYIEPAAGVVNLLFKISIHFFIVTVIISESMLQTWMELFPTRIRYILKKNSLLPSTALGCYL